MSYADLMERLERLEWPDRALDLEILARVAQAGEWAEGDITYALSDVEGTTSPPAYTASLDTAVALVERVLPDAKWDVSTTGFRPGATVVSFARRAREGAYAATPAIALLIAALKALDQQHD